MARWARRRRFNGIWLPTIQQQFANTIAVANPTGGIVIANDFTTIISGDGPWNAQTASLGTSTLQQLGTGSIALAAFQSIFLKRIVGKIHVGCIQGPNDDVWAIHVKCGIFVDRVKEDGSLANLDAWQLFNENGTQKRWMWRRSWVIGNTSNPGDYNPPGPLWPQTNAGYGSIQDGPHVDCKVKARVGYEERLFFTIQAIPVFFASVSPGTGTAFMYTTDFRVFGKVIQARGR